MKKGGAFESMIQRQLWSAGARLITPLEPPIRVVKSLGRGQFIVVFQSRGVLDFAGPLHGIHVEFDCKDIGAERFSFRTVKEHQVLRIRQLTDDCCICGIVLRMRGKTADDDLIYGIPGYALIDAIDTGEKSWSRATMESMADGGEITRLGYEKPKLLLDFFRLAAMLKYSLPANFFSKKGASPWEYLNQKMDEGSI